MEIELKRTSICISHADYGPLENISINHMEKALLAIPHVIFQQLILGQNSYICGKYILMGIMRGVFAFCLFAQWEL